MIARIERLIGRLVVMLIMTLLLTSALFYFSLPNVKLLADEYPLPRALDGSQELVLSKTRPEHWVSSKGFSPYLKKAILISEDDAFYQHDGIDWNQLKKALEERFEEGGRLRGASTITQQVAKNLYLSSEKSINRKIKEALIAHMIEGELSKDRILEIYLNVVEFGQGIYGAPRAARFYFSKSVSDVTPKEAAFLAMLLPNPKKYSVSFRRGSLTPYANSSIQRILQRMRQVGWLSEELYDTSVATPLNFEKAAIEARTEENLRASGEFKENTESDKPESMDQVEAEILQDHEAGVFDPNSESNAESPENSEAPLMASPTVKSVTGP